jgi:hypothetical protein
VPSRALPVAIVLVLLAAAARGVLHFELGDERVRRVARRYLEPLSVLAALAAGIDVLALLVSGDAGALAYAPPLFAAAAGLALWLSAEELPAAPRPEPAPEPEREPEPLPKTSLWDEPDPEPQRSTLWSGW